MKLLYIWDLLLHLREAKASPCTARCVLGFLRSLAESVALETFDFKAGHNFMDRVITG